MGKRKAAVNMGRESACSFQVKKPTGSMGEAKVKRQKKRRGKRSEAGSRRRWSRLIEQKQVKRGRRNKQGEEEGILCLCNPNHAYFLTFGS